MTIYTNVPLIKQEKQKSCWHASARMIWAFKFQQSINPLNNLFASNTGISPSQFSTLAGQLGLESVPSINMSYSWTALAELLNRHGPLWAAGHWYGAAHVVVITGVDPQGNVYINDPDGHRKIISLELFNQRIAAHIDSPIMYLPDSRASQQGYGSYFE